MRLTPEPAQCLGDCLVPVLRSVLVHHRGAGARMAEAVHQLLETGAGCGGHRPANMPGSMEMKAGYASLIACRIPDWTEVRTSQRRALGTHEHKAPPPNARRDSCNSRIGSILTAADWRRTDEHAGHRFHDVSGPAGVADR